MPEAGHLDVYPDAVMRAGQATADTASEWESWASQIRGALEYSESSVRRPRIYRAVEDYAARLVPDARRVGHRVANLGSNTTSAGGIVHNSDIDDAAVLHQQAGVAAEQGSLLSRPVNSSAVVT